jgi:hypothetical protein
MIYYYGAFTQVKILDYIVSVLRSFQLLHAERRPLVHVLAGFLAHDRRHGREGPGRQVHRRRGKMVFGTSDFKCKDCPSLTPILLQS